MYNKLTAIALLFISLLFGGLCYSSESYSPNIVVSIRPYYYLAASILQNVGQPKLLLQNNASPHDYQLKPSDIRLMHNADLIIWGGPTFEMFLAKPLQNIDESKSLKILELTTLNKLSIRQIHQHSHAHAHSHEHSHQHAAIDPHVWLSPKNGIAILHAICAALSKLDPMHHQIYQANRDIAISKIQQASIKIKQQLALVKHKPYLVFHDAYQYFEDEFQLTVAGAIAINPDIPPSAKKIHQIKQLIKNKNVHCIFSEPQFKPKIIKELTKNSSIKQGVLDPLGSSANTPATASIENYIMLLENLSSALIQGLS